MPSAVSLLGGQYTGKLAEHHSKFNDVYLAVAGDEAVEERCSGCAVSDVRHMVRHVLRFAVSKFIRGIVLSDGHE